MTDDLSFRGVQPAPVVAPASLDELTTQLAAECPYWSKEDWQRFFALSDDDKRIVAKGMKDAAVASGPDAWDITVKVLETTLTVAAGISGIAGAVSAVRGL